MFATVTVPTARCFRVELSSGDATGADGSSRVAQFPPQRRWNMEEQIYSQPEHYDLEHAGAEPDVAWFARLIKAWRPRRVLELACGSGRVTLALARVAREWRGEVVGLDASEEMLACARRKVRESPEPSGAAVQWVSGDMRCWRSEAPFDCIVCPCGSMSHLLRLPDRVSAWQTAAANLADGGRFVVAEAMANLPALAESQHVPPRALLEIDSDTARRHERLVRYRATRYFAHEQRASVRFLYDKLNEPSAVAQRFLSDYECHVFFPDEMRLLFLHAGFSIEAEWGDYERGRLGPHSPELIICGRKK